MSKSEDKRKSYANKYMAYVKEGFVIVFLLVIVTRVLYKFSMSIALKNQSYVMIQLNEQDSCIVNSETTEVAMRLKKCYDLSDGSDWANVYEEDSQLFVIPNRNTTQLLLRCYQLACQVIDDYRKTNSEIPVTIYVYDSAFYK